ncbi:hypothetical protein ACFP3U_04955 [Kitasatospora misakiensis]|uniref:Uncharacterized protein n=1 Tax=Kitasatospora misakiensis TaxID=67330 RepID=A0ABW0WXN9_9ACTN
MSVRRSLVAYTRTRPDALTAAFVELLAGRVRLLPEHVAELSAGSEDVATDGFS